MSLRFSVLDQSPIPEGATAGDALRNTLDLARLADQCGYCRYWLAEHHGTPGLACASPEAIIGPVAMTTTRLRVGSGGVMLPHYSPLKVAETFRMLADLFPGRIDLGIGRAAGTSPKVAALLQRDRRQPSPDDFPEQLAELLRYTAGYEPWLLGSTGQSAIWAAELGLPYVVADFINPNGASAAAYYLENFRPSERLQEPRTGVAVWAVCAETDEEALRLSASMRMMSLLLFRGRLIPAPPVDKAVRFLNEEGVPMELLPAGRRIITGTPQKVRSMLAGVAAEYGAGEVFVVNILHDHAARRRSYELLMRG